MPRASIVIPCYNAHKFIRQTLASALAQSMSDLEVICINNNSTDDTRQILDDFAARDLRVKVFDEPTPGEGPARQAGLAHATGDWLYFLDSDDLMEPQLLEHAIAFGEKNAVDFVIFNTYTLNDRTGEVLSPGYSFMVEWLPKGTIVFDPHEHPSRILNSFQNWVHNKLFRASFVHEHKLSFQPVHRTADLLFTCTALTESHAIGLLDERLHKYRIENPTSAMATSDSYPLDFYTALLALRKVLERDGSWNLYHDSYVGWAAVSVIANLETARSLEGFTTIATAMKNVGLAKLDLLDAPEDKLESHWHYQRIQDIANLPIDQLLFSHYADLKIRRDGVEEHASRVRMALNDANKRNSALNEELHTCKKNLRRANDELASSRNEVERLRHDFDAVWNSASFKIGRAITSPGRHIRDGLADSSNK